MGFSSFREVFTMDNHSNSSSNNYNNKKTGVSVSSTCTCTFLSSYVLHEHGHRLYTRIHAYARAHTHARVHTRTHMGAYTYTHTRTHMCVCTRTHTCAHVHTHVRTHTHVHTQRLVRPLSFKYTVIDTLSCVHSLLQLLVIFSDTSSSRVGHGLSHGSDTVDESGTASGPSSSV